MGIILLIAAAVIEISYAVFCFVTQSDHVKKGSMIRIVSFVVFAQLTIVSVIDWSLRYYALASFLLILALSAVKNVIQKRAEKRKFNTVRVVFRAVAMVMLFFVLTLPAILFPQEKEAVAATGPYAIATQLYTYTDQSRVETYADTGENRKLNVQFWYPDHLDGTYPLIVFSHGGLGIKTSNESLYHELASHGFIVCSIDHTYQCFYTTGEDGVTTWIDYGYMQELFSEDPQSDIQKSYAYYHKWMEIRTDDILFVLDTIITETDKESADWVYTLVDTAKLGVMGHSLGGSAALGIGRTRDDVSAVIALESPFLADIEGIADDRFVFFDEVYPVPVLNVYSDSAWSILSDRPQYEKNFSMLSDETEGVWNVHIRGVGHLGLTDFALTSPILTRILDGNQPTTETLDCLKTINRISLEFFNMYLKGEGGLNAES